MKVGELIDVLKDHDPEMMVIVRGYEAGYDELDRICVCSICLNVHKEWYYGRHELMTDDLKRYETVQAVNLIGKDNSK